MRKIYKSAEADQEEPEGFIAHKGEQLGMNVGDEAGERKRDGRTRGRMGLVNERGSEGDATLYECAPSRCRINFCTSAGVCVYINRRTCARIAVAPGGTCLSRLAN